MDEPFRWRRSCAPSAVECIGLRHAWQPPSRSTTRRLAAIMDPRPDAARDAALLIREAPRQLFYANTADRSGAYLRLSSMLAQACATAELAWSLPGSVAQPPFSTKSLCSQELLTFLSSARFAAAPEACWNLSTQMEARAAMPPVIALFSAILFAVLPNVHPPQLKPMTTVARNPMNAPCMSRLSESPCRIEGTCMGVPFVRHISERVQRIPGWAPVSKSN